jgi:hypothetical protein
MVVVPPFSDRREDVKEAMDDVTVIEHELRERIPLDDKWIRGEVWDGEGRKHREVNVNAPVVKENTVIAVKDVIVVLSVPSPSYLNVCVPTSRCPCE